MGERHGLVGGAVVGEDHGVDDLVRQVVVRAFERARGVVRRHDDDDFEPVQHCTLLFRRGRDVNNNAHCAPLIFLWVISAGSVRPEWREAPYRRAGFTP